LFDDNLFHALFRTGHAISSAILQSPDLLKWC